MGCGFSIFWGSILGLSYYTHAFFFVVWYERSGFFSGEKNKKLMLNERTVNETICFLAERMLVEEFEKP